MAVENKVSIYGQIRKIKKGQSFFLCDTPATYSAA